MIYKVVYLRSIIPWGWTDWVKTQSSFSQNKKVTKRKSDLNHLKPFYLAFFAQKSTYFALTGASDFVRVIILDSRFYFQWYKILLWKLKSNNYSKGFRASNLKVQKGEGLRFTYSSNGSKLSYGQPVLVCNLYCIVCIRRMIKEHITNKERNNETNNFFYL